MDMPCTFSLRPAEARDVAAVVALITELAEFEKLSHLLNVDAQRLHPHLFGDKPVAECVVGEVAGQVVGFALFFSNFSTFRCSAGLYLEDLYVQPAHRHTGLGTALLQHLGTLAVARGCRRFEWTVLDWNANAIGFYEKMGAKVLPEWRICRVDGEALQALAVAAHT
jgi:GNAT superfamily N-acetyltransferase